jgi:hypothetical protein
MIRYRHCGGAAQTYYESVNRFSERGGGGSAVFQSQGRLSDDRKPSGSRSNYIFSSPHYKPNSSFNFWNDITLNHTMRNKWENKSLNDNEDFRNRRYSEI